MLYIMFKPPLNSNVQNSCVQLVLSSAAAQNSPQLGDREMQDVVMATMGPPTLFRGPFSGTVQQRPISGINHCDRWHAVTTKDLGVRHFAARTVKGGVNHTVTVILTAKK